MLSNEKKKYTIRTHIRRLKLMLNKAGALKSYCPAALSFKPSLSPKTNWNDLISPCDVCRDFVDVKGFDCPCHYFGNVVARKKTIDAIKEYEKNK